MASLTAPNEHGDERLQFLERMEETMHNGGPAMTMAEIEELESLRWA